MFPGASSEQEAEDSELLPANKPAASSAFGRQHDKQPALHCQAPRKTASGNKADDLACHASTWLPTASGHAAFVSAELCCIVLYAGAAHCHASTYLLCSICDCRAGLHCAVCCVWCNACNHSLLVHAEILFNMRASCQCSGTLHIFQTACCSTQMTVDR